MCFPKAPKPPKLPELTPEEKADEELRKKEDLAARATQRELMANQKADAAAKLAKDKLYRTESDIAKQSGNYGIRSLISGSKGGSGFLPSGMLNPKKGMK